MFRPKKHNRRSGQTLVEFALIFPILIFLLIGIMEVGHLLFFYATTSMAAREASRYGATVGTNADGTPHYQDCDGIFNTADRLLQVAGATDRTITIEYDEGPNDGCHNAGNCITCDQADAISNTGFGTRIVVTVHTVYRPILPLFPISEMEFTVSSARTIVKNIPAGDGSGGSSGGGGGGSSNTPTPAPTTANTPTPTPPPTNTPTPEPTSTPTPEPTATPPSTTLNCTLVYDRGNAWYSWFEGVYKNNADLAIQITGDQGLHNWTLDWSYTYDQTIYNAWNMTYSQAGSNVHIVPKSYNDDIAANGEVSNLGLQYRYSNNDALPSVAVLSGTLDDGNEWHGACTITEP